MMIEENEDKSSLSRTAYDRLRGEILSGFFTPDQPLRLELLRERYGISFSPLREALNQLHAEQLVSYESKRGFRVAAVSLTKMWDAINTRILIETEALRQSIAHGHDDWEGAVISSFHALEKCRERLVAGTTADPMLLEALEARHQQFHTALLQGCPSELLLRLSATLYAQTERYRRPLLSVPHPETVDARGPDSDHRALMTAALARDADRATELLRAHLTATGQFIARGHGFDTQADSPETAA